MQPTAQSGYYDKSASVPSLMGKQCTHPLHEVNTIIEIIAGNEETHSISTKPTKKSLGLVVVLSFPLETMALAFRGT